MSARKMFILGEGDNTPPPSGDPYWNSVLFLTHLDQGDSNDRAGQNSISIGGADLSPTDPKFGTDSLNIVASSGGLTATGSLTNTIFNVPTTIEMFVKWTSQSGPGSFTGSVLFATSANATFATSLRGCFALQLTRSNGAMAVSFYGTSARENFIPGYSLPFNQWVHIVLERSVNGVWTLYADGISRGTFTPSQDLRSQGGGMKFGSWLPGAVNVNTFGGFFDEIRITRGVARYQGNFTPPDAPFPNFFGA